MIENCSNGLYCLPHSLFVILWQRKLWSEGGLSKIIINQAFKPIDVAGLPSHLLKFHPEHRLASPPDDTSSYTPRLEMATMLHLTHVVVPSACCHLLHGNTLALTRRDAIPRTPLESLFGWYALAPRVWHNPPSQGHDNSQHPQHTEFPRRIWRSANGDIPYIQACREIRACVQCVHRP